MTVTDRIIVHSHSSRSATVPVTLRSLNRFSASTKSLLTGYNSKCPNIAAVLPGGHGAITFNVLVERAHAEFTINMVLTPMHIQWVSVLC
jgi:hypothetical protein